MIGKHQIVIDSVDFLKGMSSGSEISDGGFSNETYSVNPIAEPGVLFVSAKAVNADTDTTLTGEIIASCPDSTIASSDQRIAVTDDAKYYSYNGTKLSAVLDTDATAGVVYADGVVDMIPFNGKIYTTNDDNITELSRPSTLNKTYHAFANGATIHPALVYENNAYYGDGPLLLRQTPTTTPATILTLSTGHLITALGIDHGTGKMLIASSGTQNVSDTLPSVNKIMWYDGFSNKVIKSINVEDMVTAFYTVAGVVYVGYGRNLGYLTGSGIQFLRTLKNVTFSNTELPYKQHFANIGTTLYVIDGSQILAFGEVLPGSKIFYYCYKNYITADDSATKFRAIFHAGNSGTTKKLGISVDTTKFYTLDVTSKADLDKLYFYTNWFRFPRPINIIKMRVETKDSIASTDSYVFSYETSDGTGLFGLAQENGTDTTTFIIPDIIGFGQTGLGQDPSTTAFRVLIQNSIENDGIRRIIIYYSYAE